MFIFSNFILAVAQVVSIFLKIFYWLLLIRVLISWVSPNPFNPLVQFLYRSTEPILDPIRKIMPPMGMVDLSPLVAFILIIFLQSFLVRSLFDMAYHLR